jgi:hypothetical protein
MSPIEERGMAMKPVKPVIIEPVITEEYTDADFDLAQARLERIEEPLRCGAESDEILYRSLEAIFQGPEPAEIKEGMVICLLEKFFLRVRTPTCN